MKTRYWQRVVNYLKRTEERELSVKEIAERMKPVPYESIEHLLPKSFAHNVRLILEARV